MKKAECTGGADLAERVVELDSMELAVAIFGNCDQNIRMLENEFHVTAVCRGSQLKLVGEPEGVTGAAQAIDGMLTLLQNHTPEDPSGTVHR